MQVITYMHPCSALLPDPSIITEEVVLQDAYDYRRVDLPSFGAMESVLRRGNRLVEKCAGASSARFSRSRSK